jgi:hypothetical protein
MQLADLTLGQGDDPDAGKREPLVQRRDILLIARQAIERLRDDDLEPVSIGTEWGPRIGLQKGTPVRVRWRARAWSTRSRRRSGELAREAALGVGLDQARFLKRQLSLPVSTMSQWWVSRSSRAVVILASPKTLGHSPKARLVVTITELRS